VASFLTNSYVASILSNIATLVIAGLPGGAWYLLRRRRLRAFFGLRRTRRVFIYASRVDVPKWGSRGIDGSPRSFAGIATPDYEAKLIANINGFFGGFTPRILRWQNIPLLRWADIDVQALASPASKEEIRRDGTVITIGSPAYNLVSRSVEEDFDAPVRFANDNAELATRAGTPVGGTTNGVAQRVVDQTTGQVAFYLAGPSVAGTTAAAKYLLRDWRRLAKQHPSGQFYEVLRATSNDGDYVVVSDQPNQRTPRGGRWRRRKT